MTTVLLLTFIVGVFLVGLALGRLHGTEQQVERMQHELERRGSYWLGGAFRTRWWSRWRTSRRGSSMIS